VTAAADDGTGGRRLVLRHPAHPAQLRPLRNRLSRWAAENAVPADAVLDLQLAVGEAVSNGMEHAYQEGDCGTVQVELELRLADAEPVVAVVVIDYGRWRPIPVLKGYRGRGLDIIKQLTRGLRIRTTEHGTRLSFVVPVGP
jgi:anti-sigma regulatory factor (Ser/Thr protein kinase)